MKTIKIIDLLNKIANGEKVKPFEVYGEKYYVNEDGYINNRDGNVNWLIYDEWLNQEVEIPDEEDEFEDIEHYDMFDYFGGYDFGGTDKKLLCDLQSNFEHINNELDKLIKNQKKIIERLKDE